MIYIGVDPGMSGAVARLSSNGTANVWDIPTREAAHGREYNVGELVEVMRRAARPLLTGETIVATVETAVIVPNKVRGRPDWKGQSARTTAVQWRGVGIVEGILAGLGIPYELVQPAAWKRALGVTRDKQTSRERARELFPAAAHLIYRQKDDGRAEALLLAKFGMSRQRKLPL